MMNFSNATSSGSNHTVIALLPGKGQQYKFPLSGIAFIPISLIGTSGCLLCLWTLYLTRTSNRRSTIDPLFISLNLYLLLFCLFCCPLDAYTSLVGVPNFLTTPTYFPLCRAVGFVYMVASSADVYMHAAIAFHRFFAVVVTYQANRLKSRLTTIALASAPWVISATILVFPLFHLGGEYGYSLYIGRCSIPSVYSMVYYHFMRSFSFFSSAAVIIICYSAIGIKLVVPHRAVASLAGPNLLLQTAKKRRETELTKVAFALCFLFLVCLLPTTVYVLAAKTQTQLYSTAADALVVLTTFGSVCNPWLIIVLTPALRKVLLTRFSTHHRVEVKEGSSNTRVTRRSRKIYQKDLVDPEALREKKNNT